MKILIVEDHSIIREYLQNYLKEHFPEGDIEVLRSFEPGLISEISNIHPDLVILDISLDKLDALDFFKELKSFLPKTYFIIYTMHNITSYKKFFWKAGADAYLLKEDAQMDLKNVILSVLGGERVFPLEFDIPPDQYQLNQITLTLPEKQLLQAILDNISTENIAQQMNCTEKDVLNLRKKLLTKSGAKNTRQLLNYALDYNWLR